MSVKSDIEIAREASSKPIQEVAARVGVPADAVMPYGATKAKVSFDFINSLQSKPDAKLVLVTAISPTPAGEGGGNGDVHLFVHRQGRFSAEITSLPPPSSG